MSGDTVKKKKGRKKEGKDALQIMHADISMRPLVKFRYSEQLCVCVCSVTQRCLTLCDPEDCSCQARLSVGFSRQEHWIRATISSSRGSSQARDQTLISCVSCIGRQILHQWATCKALRESKEAQIKNLERKRNYVKVQMNHYPMRTIHCLIRH